ncbi:MAG: hypothetical protein EPO52_06955 [Herbiconiux sp.]|uniref:hypothetical protein n=1 Tax=Herbiconiux sp. TaxID=1871186 RepID=UPI001205C5BB|nr:hypothetical protein [Herbiconiux sp.]TAJ47923.1 MAG: hypothetical protein EPO52_06955 [Herbiconiux sp.]
MTQPPADQPPRHPGYGPNPPGASHPVSYGQPDAAQPAHPAPAQPGYAAPGHPGAQVPQQPRYEAPGQTGYPAPGQPPRPQHPGYGSNPSGAPAPQSGAAGRNPLGLASLVVGAIDPLLGLVFLFVQAGALRVMSGDIFGAISTVHTVLSALIGIAAVVLGIVALSRRGTSKTFAAAGIALGAAALVGVLGAVIYPVLVQLMYM